MARAWVAGGGNPGRPTRGAPTSAHGKEAGNVRKALLVLVLIAASFAGGAAVNGPGLAWLRDAVGLTPPRIEPGLAADDPDADFDLDPAPKRTSRARPSTPRRAQAADAAPATAAPMADPRPSQSVTPNNGPPTREPQAAAPPSRPPTAASDPGPGSLDSPAPPPLEPPASAAARASEPAPANPPARPAEEARGDRDLARAAGSESTPAGPPTWADLAGRLKAAGVDRFWVEGAPGGPVRFRCVVPLVGRGAVGQQFEAEADDVHAAAELALRRVVLWRAAQER